MPSKLLFVSPSVLHLQSHTYTFNIAKAKRDLGYTPLYTVAEGIQKCLEMYKGNDGENKKRT